MQVIPPLQVIDAHRGGIWSVCASLSGLLVTAGDEGLIKSWRVETQTGRILPLAEADTAHREVLLIRQSPKGVLVSAGHEGGLATWELDPVSGKLVQRQQLILSDDRQHYNDRLLETTSGFLLAWAYGTVGPPALCQWSEKEQAFFFRQELPIERASCFLELPSGELLAGNHAGQVSCWQLEAASGVWHETGVLQAHEGPVHALASTREGTWISAGGDDPLIKVWSGRSGGEGWRFQQILQGHRSRILDVVESSRGEVLSTDQGERFLAGWRQRPELFVWRKTPQGFHLVQRQTGRLRRLGGDLLIVEEDGESSLSLWRRVGEAYERIAVLGEGKRGGMLSLELLRGETLVAGTLDGSLVSWELGSLHQATKEEAP